MQQAFDAERSRKETVHANNRIDVIIQFNDTHKETGEPVRIVQSQGPENYGQPHEKL